MNKRSEDLLFNSLFGNGGSVDTAELDEAVTEAKSAASTATTKASEAAASASHVDQVKASIPETFEELEQDVTDLKADLIDLESSGTVPNADALLSDDYVTESVPYLYRQTGGGIDGAGSREIDEIVGGSVVWNQLLDKSNYPQSTTVSGITFTNNNDGSITVSGTATATAVYELGNVYQNTLPLGHKYIIITGTQSAGSSSTFEVMLTRFNGTSSVNCYKDGIFARTEGESSTVAIQRRIVIRSGYAASNLVFKPQIIDLTAMFGSTVADYIYSLEQSTAGAGVALFRKLFPNDYYEYNAGELMSVSGVSAHVMRDSDDNIIGNYPLDSSLTLRGIPKLDANNNIYYDGDTYASDGTVTRRYGTRAYQSGDESLADAITDGTNTVYKLTTLTTETADPYTNPQICDKYGTEEYVTTGIVPVGHSTKYLADLKDKIEGLPWNFASLIAPTEETYKATQNYTTGSLFIVENVLYKATANIANGGTITPNTNCTATTLAEVISALS